jgi:2'-5' RNA ligase
MAPQDRTILYRQVWEAFLRSETTSDGRHDTPHWRAHRDPYAACVVRIPPTTFRPDLESLRIELAQLSGVRVHPAHFRHVMVQELGFLGAVPNTPDEISSAWLEEFAQAAIEPVARLAPFPIELGGANSFHDAVFLEVHRAAPLESLHERLFDLAALPHTPAYPYLPHCTIAHYDGTTNPREAGAVINPWCHASFGQTIVTELEIETIDPSEPYPELETYAALPLLH